MMNQGQELANDDELGLIKGWIRVMNSLRMMNQGQELAKDDELGLGTR